MSKEVDLINVLTNQRNQALDAAADLQAMLIGLDRELKDCQNKNFELQKQLEALTKREKSNAK